MSKKQIIEKIVLQIVKQYSKERCALLGYVPNEIPKGTFDEQQEYKIKIAGDYTFFRDTAVWKTLNETSKFKDLDLNHIEMELILNRFLNEFCNNQKNEIIEISQVICKNKTTLINPDNTISDFAQILLNI